MGSIRDKVVVDFIPVIDGGDVRKIYDHGITKFNQIILGVLNNLYMRLGTMEDFPGVGCMDDLLSIYFKNTDSIGDIADRISNNLKSYQQASINCDIFVDEDDNTSAHMMITVDDIPNYRFTANISKTGQNIKIINPEITEV